MQKSARLVTCFESEEKFLELSSIEKSLCQAITYSSKKYYKTQVSVSEVIKHLKYIRSELKAYELAIYADYEDYFKPKKQKYYKNKTYLPDIIGLELIRAG